MMSDVLGFAPNSNMAMAIERLDRRGAVMVNTDIDTASLARTLPSFVGEGRRPGRRLFQPPSELKAHLRLDGAIGQYARAALSEAARPTRVLLFNKSEQSNWAVPWHQDRTIAVSHKVDAPGFEVWSTKEGVLHVEPPQEVLDRTVSLRLHLDEVSLDNAPLKTLVSSHKLGRVAVQDVQHHLENGQIDIHVAGPGDLLILRTSILHASDRAEAPQQRRVIHVDYCDALLPDGMDWALPWDPAPCS